MLNQFKSSLDRALSAIPDWKSLRSAWTEKKYPVNISGAKGVWSAFVIFKLAKITPGSILIITPDETEATQLASDLKIFTPEVSKFPWWGTMLYRGISPEAAVFGQRASVLALLASKEKRIIVASLRAALGYVPPPEYFRESTVKLTTGMKFGPEQLEQCLVKFGYSRVPQVAISGEFTVRGEVIDIAPMGVGTGIRVVYDWNEIGDIRKFDRSSQISFESIDNLILHPLKEVIWDEESLASLTEKSDSDVFAEVIQNLQKGLSWRGEEVFFPLAFKSPATLQDYLTENSAAIFMNYQQLEVVESNLQKEYEKLYESALEQKIPAPRPEALMTQFKDFYTKRNRKLTFNMLRKQHETSSYFLPCEPGRSFFGNFNFMNEEFNSLKGSGYTVYIFSDSDTQIQRIAYLLREHENIVFCSSKLSSGFSLPNAKIIVIQENEIFGRRNRSSNVPETSKTEALESYLELEPGDLVVHMNYGIGRFTGIKRIKTSGSERDYISLEYMDEEIIFLPIEQVNYIQRYIGSQGRSPKLDRIGSQAWQKKKARARKTVAELADKLIKLYAIRQTAKGLAFPKDDDFQVSFEAAFPWEETRDQLKAIEDVKRDMESPQPMDRLICGDAGYGKTEIAMRATFKAVMGGRQVAYLCPTTILAEQQYLSFIERFKRFPVKLNMLSRFVSSQDRKKAIDNICAGEIDIVIGTHRILSKDMKFKNLGLLIIDEEQRFGVKHKERLKEIKSNVDCLTLSATPIPRTLYMSLLKIRDISVLNTAPGNRLPIETFVQEFNPELIARSIRREVERNGQIFYLHNRIETLEATCLFVQKLVPEVLVESAHGQMPANDLEDVMHRFIQGNFQVLVSTTIIENGLDIPNVNTIIIDRADIFGISQLYQIRGRVGRSGRLAYAYLLYPENHEISELAIKRLQVISDFTELGSGFKIAMKDLEVRGSGNILGREQSGEVQAIGLELYLRLLDDEIRKRTNEDYQNDWETYFELDYSGYIPDSCIQNEVEKMEVYKRIAAIDNDSKLQSLESELLDRFGSIPDELYSLLSMAQIRIICKKLKVSHVREREGIVQIRFGKLSIISINKVMNLIKASGGRINLIPDSPDGLQLNTGSLNLKEKSEFIREKLECLM